MADDRRHSGMEKRGLRIGLMNNIMVGAAVAVSILLLYATSQAITGYNNLQKITQRYITCQQDAITFQESSDYLTNESRLFVITGDIVHANNYFEEVEVTRRREKAIDEIDEYLQEAESYGYLAKSLEHSNDLVEVELYAMRLSVDAHGLELEQMPETLRAVELAPEDAARSAEDKKALAMDMMFGVDYLAQKERIHEGVEMSIDALVEDTLQDQIGSAEHLSGLLRKQQYLVCLQLVMLFVVVMCTYVLVIKPLKRSVSRICDQQRIPVSGSYEMRFLAHTYNEMFDRQTRSTEELTYSAMHDSLTGVYNRTAYDTMFPGFDIAEIAVLIIDIDKFKDFNDNYGHDIGDKVLQRVARVIIESFRSEDYVFRIGGDEFCVIMVHATSQLSDLVRGKVTRANAMLQNPTDGLPKVSLSVGVAFGDRKNPVGDIFKDADTALYNVKRKSRGNCAIFGE